MYIYFSLLYCFILKKNNARCLQVNGIEVLFRNCDRTPNSQMTLFVNPDDNKPTSKWFYRDFPFCRSLFGALETSPSGQVAVPQEYFTFVEINFGGCGCFTQTDGRRSIRGTVGAAIGFR